MTESVDLVKLIRES